MSVSHIAETLRRIRKMESQNTAPSLLWEDDDERHAKLSIRLTGFIQESIPD